VRDDVLQAQRRLSYAGSKVVAIFLVIAHACGESFGAQVSEVMDVFIRTYEKQVDHVRRGFALATIGRWALEPVNIHLIEASMFGITAGRAMAEQRAESDPYIFTDDDVLIVGKDWVERGEKAMLSHPEYAVVSTLSLIETENAATPASNETEVIYPMHWVGAPMWIRKGILTELPEMTLGSECGDIHRIVLGKGYQEGLFHPNLRLRHNHMGHGFSSNPNLHWGY